MKVTIRDNTLYVDDSLVSQPSKASFSEIITALKEQIDQTALDTPVRLAFLGATLEDFLTPSARWNLPANTATISNSSYLKLQIQYLWSIARGCDYFGRKPRIQLYKEGDLTAGFYLCLVKKYR